MTDLDEHGFRFSPSRVEGMEDVSQVVVYATRLEILQGQQMISIDFLDIAEWPRPRSLFQGLARLGLRSRLLMVGERDWFKPPTERFIRFYTAPHITVYMPEEPPGTDVPDTVFRRIQYVMMDGGFGTYDLG